MNNILWNNVVSKLFAPSLSRCMSAQYFPGFVYYPRYPDQKDPPITPSKVFMVELTKSFKYQPWRDRKTLTMLGLNEREYGRQRRVVLKNTPEVNAMLWKVKHLIRITPITFPNGEPTEKDIGSTRLTHSGEMKISCLHRPDPAEVQAEIDFRQDPKRLDRLTKKKDSMLRWNKGFDLD